jgi:hypothetical protein
MGTRADMDAWLVKLGVAGEQLATALAVVPGAAAAGAAVAQAAAGRSASAPVSPAAVVPGIRNANARFDDDEADVAATPMALPDDAKKPPAKTKPAKTQVISFGKDEGSVVEVKDTAGEIKKRADFVKNLMQEIKTQSDVRILNLQVAILTACTDFQSFSGEKVEKLKHLEELDKLALSITKVVVTAVTGGVGGLAVEGELAKEVVKAVIEVAAEGIAKKAEKVIDDSSKGFEKMVATMVVEAKNSASQFREKLKAKVVPKVDAIYDVVDKNGTLDPKQLHFTELFLHANPSKLEKELERACAVPSDKTCQKLQLNIYQGMIEKFMEKYIIATNPGKGIEWNIGGGYEPKMYAHRAAVKEKLEKQKSYGYTFDE